MMSTYTKKIHIQDNVHEYIAIDPKIKSMIDTPEFQRLRMVKQLGLTDYVFPSATHTRFSHSLGVQHLARKVITKLKEEQHELKITEDEVFAVSAAGLCHDLGHGPFSHSFEHITHVRHEDMSIKLIRQMVKNKSSLRTMVADHTLDLICALVSPKTHSKIVETYTQIGRGWLFDIVCNELNGIDVDKWDYLLRDSKHLAIPISFKYSRMVADCRVIDGHICYLDKCSNDIQLLFKSRYELFKQCYTHHTTAAVEYMITGIFSLADKHFGITKKAPNPEEFLHLDDTLIQMIKRTNVNDIKNMEARNGIIKAQQIIKRMDYHDFYKCAGYILLPPELLSNSTNLKIEYNVIKCKWKKQIFEILQNKVKSEHKGDITEDDIMCQLFSIGYGMEDRHPFENVLYYRSSQPNKSFLLEIDQISLVAMDAHKWKEVIFRVFVKKEEWRKDVAKAFSIFKTEQELVDLTPGRAKADVESVHVSPKTSGQKKQAANTDNDTDGAVNVDKVDKVDKVVNGNVLPFEPPPSSSSLFKTNKVINNGFDDEIQREMNKCVDKEINCLATELQCITAEIQELEKRLQGKRQQQDTVMGELDAVRRRMKQMGTSYVRYEPNMDRSRQMDRLNVSPHDAHSHHHQHFYIQHPVCYDEHRTYGNAPQIIRSYDNTSYDGGYNERSRPNRTKTYNTKQYRNTKHPNWKK